MSRPPAPTEGLSPKQLAALVEMRSKFANKPSCIQDVNSWFQLEDWTFLRYLRARDYNVHRATKMLEVRLTCLLCRL
jgi:hypothetical protein